MIFDGDLTEIEFRASCLGQMASLAIPRIASYARDRRMRPLELNHVRSFDQPWGIISWATDLDLATGRLIQYPGTHSMDLCESEGECDAEWIASLKLLLQSDAFRELPAENADWGFDGGSIFIEANLAGFYSWKCHLASDDPVHREVIKAIGACRVPDRW